MHVDCRTSSMLVCPGVVEQRGQSRPEPVVADMVAAWLHNMACIPKNVLFHFDLCKPYFTIFNTHATQSIPYVQGPSASQTVDRDLLSVPCCRTYLKNGSWTDQIISSLHCSFEISFTSSSLHGCSLFPALLFSSLFDQSVRVPLNTLHPPPLPPLHCAP